MTNEKDFIKTFDNEVLGEGSFDALIQAIFRKKPSTLKKIGELELAERIVENFIMSNTKKDIDAFMRYMARVIIIDGFMDFLRHGEDND